MAKNKNKALPRQHKIMSHPYLALVLVDILSWMVLIVLIGIEQNVFASITGPVLDALMEILTGTIILLLYRRWFKGEFNGRLSLSTKNLKKGLLMLAPTLVFAIINLTEIKYATLTAKDVLLAFFVAIAPGLGEEVFGRITTSNYMRIHRDGKGVVLFATISGIVFGASHLMNLSTGAALDDILLKIFYAAGLGVLYAAVFFRTGSMLPAILSHWFIDFTSGMTPGSSGSGLTTGDILYGLGFGALMAAIGYWLLRKAKRDEMVEVWAEKWPAQPAAENEAPAEEAE